MTIRAWLALFGIYPKREMRLYLVAYIFDGGHGATVIEAEIEKNATQQDVYDCFLKAVQDRSPNIDKIVLSSITIVPGNPCKKAQ